MKKVKVEKSPLLRELKKAHRRRWLRLFKKKRPSPTWLDKLALPRIFTLAEDASSYQERLKVEEGTEHLRPFDLIFAPAVNGERRRPKTMQVHRVADKSHIEVRYVPKKRRRMKASTPLILIGTICPE